MIEEDDIVIAKWDGLVTDANDSSCRIKPKLQRHITSIESMKMSRPSNGHFRHLVEPSRTAAPQDEQFERVR